MLTVAAVASAQVSALARAKITSVTFKNVNGPNPQVTIRGSGFGARPAHDPSFPPTPPQGNTPPYGCSETGKVGWNYGTQLWISITSTTHLPWSAGRYRPALNELDCIGLTILKYTGNQVVYRLAAGYHEGGYKLAMGDRYVVSVKGAKRSGVVG
jgi:hypothetical protein